MVAKKTILTNENRKTVIGIQFGKIVAPQV